MDARLKELKQRYEEWKRMSADERFRYIVDHVFEPTQSWEEEDGGEGDYLLVEEDDFDGSHWLTRHNSIEEAAEYHASNETMTWIAHRLIQLSTGKVWIGLRKVEFELLDDPTHHDIHV